MPPRDEQDYESRRQQIIDAALQVFASKGFERATNKDIAAAAHIRSAGLIYHYFKDKTDLFRQVLEERTPAIQLVARGDELMDVPPRELLTTFSLAFVQTFNSSTTVAMFKLMLSESIRHPAVAEVFNKIGPGRGVAFLTRYLAHQMEKGTLRKMDPGAATRCFVGPLLAYMITREVFVQPDSESLSAQTLVQTAVDIFLQGLEVKGNG